MAPDTATPPNLAATDHCVGFAEPADIRGRLTPDDLHPAQLAGPHAWHPWGLTAAPPTDRHLRLSVWQALSDDGVEQLLDRLETRLSRLPWPPAGPLEIRRDGAKLDCRDHDTRRSLIEVTRVNDGNGRKHVDVVTRDGWPILDELAALNDRIRCIDANTPARRDLADLASWVEHKMARATTTDRLGASLQQLLSDQARDHPTVNDRLRAVLVCHRATTGQHGSALDFLADHVHQRLQSGPSRSR